VITGRQIRAARGFLAWDRRDLAQKAVITVSTVERIETDGEIPRTTMSKALSAIRAALEAEGIEFTDEGGVPGVRLHLKKIRRANASKIRSGSR
jgi:ribosome-binding protein aMBF1 (putative translation factor)